MLIAGHNEQHLNDTLKDLQSEAKGGLSGIVADLGAEEGIEKLFAEADKLFGGQLDVLISNAAVAYGSVTEGSFADWQSVINTNLLGHIACTRMALDRMTEVKSPLIIYIGSMSADVREPNSAIYVATKAGIQGFAESLRKEVNKRGVRITLIEPGAVDTDMQQEKTSEKSKEVDEHRMLAASDIASAVIYALSQEERCDVVEIRLRPRLQLI